MPDLTLNVTEATFPEAVLKKSEMTPVVVDFWAPWCGPCRQLAPVLERVTAQYQGQIILTKINVDENPNISAQFDIQGIPAVKAFRDAKVVNEFTGALPENAVQQFFETLLTSEADKAATLHTEEGYRKALELEHTHAGAILGLARIMTERAAHQEALTLLERLPATGEAGQLVARIHLALEAEDDQAAQLALAGEYTQALELYLERVRSAPDPDAKKSAQDNMLRLFAILGDDHPLTKTYRRKLAGALF